MNPLASDWPEPQTDELPVVVLPEARAWIDIRPDAAAVADAILVGPGNWLTRGSGLLIVGPTGCGKSTLDATLAFSFALGREIVGLRPSRPLKSLVIQAEDDDLDLREMARGIVADLAPNDDERETLRANVQIVTERAKTGTAFIALAASLLELHRPDLLHLNPLSAFFGDDLNDQRAVAAFFRTGFNPLLSQHRCALLSVHHPAKPSKERDGWRDGAQAYAGSGSADLANWAREVMTLRQVAPGLYELAATKRWRKLGWKDADGKPSSTRLIAHARDGLQVWRDATGETLAALGATRYTAAGLCALVPEAGIDKAELRDALVDKFTVSERTAANYLSDSCRVRRHNVNGQNMRCALLAETQRPRRDVYPDQPANRPVVWVTLTEEGKRLCKR